MTATTSTPKVPSAKRVSKHPLRNLNILAGITFILTAIFYVIVHVGSSTAGADLLATALLAITGLYLLLIVVVTTAYAIGDRHTRNNQAAATPDA